MAALEFFLGWTLRNLKYTKSNKKITWIQYISVTKKKKKKKTTQIHEVLQIFY